MQIFEPNFGVITVQSTWTESPVHKTNEYKDAGGGLERGGREEN
jgi:hypothetical protein